MDDITTYALLGTSFFFVAVSFGLLARYRQTSQKINESTDLGRDLWSSLEQRLNKQDERILDVMGRLEVVQARVLAAATIQTQPPLVVSETPKPPVPPEQEPVVEAPVATPVSTEMQQPQSQASQESQATAEPASSSPRLDETQITAIRLLATSPQNTRQLTDALRKSREHTARIMKQLFEMGLVGRNDSSKPFVYQLTDLGRRYLQ